MARTDISVTDQPFQGSTTISYTSGDATNNMKFVNTGTTILIASIGSTSTTITIKAVDDMAGRSVDESVTTTGNEVVLGPFNQSWWNQSGTDEIHVDLDQDTGVNLAALRLD